MIEEFKDDVKGCSKNILNAIKKLELWREQEINKKWNKKKVKYVRWWNKRYIKKVRCRFNNFKTEMWIFKKSYECDSIKKERELRILAKKRINKIKRSKKLKTIRINY